MFRNNRLISDKNFQEKINLYCFLKPVDCKLLIIKYDVYSMLIKQ